MGTRLLNGIVGKTTQLILYSDRNFNSNVRGVMYM